MSQGYLTPRAFVQHYMFVGPNLTATNGTLLSHGTLGAQTYWMPRRGSIVGVSGSLNAALTAGTLTVQAYIDGSAVPAFSASAALLHLSQQAGFETVDSEKDNYRFTAGQSIGLRYTSSDSVAPLTTDGIFLLEVLLEDVTL